jgi:hypothetical protein
VRLAIDDGAASLGAQLGYVAGFAASLCHEAMALMSPCGRCCWLLRRARARRLAAGGVLVAVRQWCCLRFCMRFTPSESRD